MWLVSPLVTTDTLGLIIRPKESGFQNAVDVASTESF